MRVLTNKMTNFQINDLRTLFLYLSNAVISLPDIYQEQVFKDMAYKLHEWNGIPISELRTVLQDFDIQFNDTCFYCGEEMVDAPDDQMYCSYSCKVQDCGCKASPSCCGSG